MYNIDRPEYEIYDGFPSGSLDEQEQRHLLANWQVIQLINEIDNGSELAWLKDVLEVYGVYVRKNS